VRWETESPTGEAKEGTLAVDQSGQFCTFHFDGQRRSFSMKMIGGTALGQSGTAGLPVARLEGDGHQITLYSTAVQDSLRLELDGHEQYRALIDRISRPGDLAESDSPKPPPVADARP
jgi:hypothetical protein